MNVMQVFGRILYNFLKIFSNVIQIKGKKKHNSRLKVQDNKESMPRIQDFANDYSLDVILDESM